jgi:hypothetical protein
MFDRGKTITFRGKTPKIDFGGNAKNSGENAKNRKRQKNCENAKKLDMYTVSGLLDRNGCGYVIEP